MRLPIVFVFVLSFAGCGANAASRRDTLPASNVTQCRSLCGSAGMQLQSLVIVANQTGCVCGPGTAGTSAAATGGAVAVLLAQQRQQQQR